MNARTCLISLIPIASMNQPLVLGQPTPRRISDTATLGRNRSSTIWNRQYVIRSRIGPKP